MAKQTTTASEAKDSNLTASSAQLNGQKKTVQNTDLAKVTFEEKLSRFHQLKKAETYLTELHVRRMDLSNLTTQEGGTVQQLKLIGADGATYHTSSKYMIDKVVNMLLDECDGRIQDAKNFLNSNL